MILAQHQTVDAVTLLRRAARTYPDRIAFQWESGQLRYRDLMARVDRVAAAFAAAGVMPGDRVAFMLRNGPTFLEVYLATLHLGAICVPLNFRLKAAEVAYQVNDADPRLLIADEETAGEASAASLPGSCRLVVDGRGKGTDNLAHLVGAAPDHVPATAIDLSAPASLLYTSGTTGLPKGVIRSHFSLAYLIPLRAATMGFGPDSVHLAPTPMFNAGGHEFMMLETLASGGRVIVRRRFDVPEVIDLVARERVTHAYFVPTMGIRLMDAIEAAAPDWRSLRMWMSAAAPLPEALRDRIRAALPATGLWISYGITEVGAVTFLRPTDVARKPGHCVGPPMMGVAVRCVDDQGHECPPGGAGEVVCRSPEAMTGYWRNPKATADTIRHGWVRTGDVGTFDDERYLYLLDRIKDIVISGGDNVYVSEVENRLASAPQVLEVAVIGTPHPEWGEAVVAVVVPRAGVRRPDLGNDLIAFARDGLAHYKCPKRVVFAEELPRSEYGKVLKTELRRRYRDLFTGAHP
ncbi:MAG: long-chain fatty acid--CoA ligase [Alphaproteobacteria bacterium]|nr:long-chain fatty acid--CoA ligase [Alphaproteobacteria bacterium]